MEIITSGMLIFYFSGHIVNQYLLMILCFSHRIYAMHGEEGPTRVYEIEAHSDRVDSIQWANKGLRFVSGSKDGTAIVWQFKRQKWAHLRLEMTTKLPG